jgi:hypothetical protein
LSVSSERTPDLTLFLDILSTLEEIGASYVIIGAFAAVMYGSTRATYDIDIVVDLHEKHIDELASAYPPPRYYADSVQMRDAIRLGGMFNIIDTTRGEKADLIPLKTSPWYRHALRRRVRQRLDLSGREPMHVWFARADDVIVGKLMAWQEGKSHKHELDIRDMLVAHYLNTDASQAALLDDAYVSTQVMALEGATVALWHALRDSARAEAAAAQQK